VSCWSKNCKKICITIASYALFIGLRAGAAHPPAPHPQITMADLPAALIVAAPVTQTATLFSRPQPGPRDKTNEHDSDGDQKSEPDGVSITHARPCY
jgi:hypothetical protein